MESRRSKIGRNIYGFFSVSRDRRPEFKILISIPSSVPEKRVFTDRKAVPTLKL